MGYVLLSVGAIRSLFDIAAMSIRECVTCLYALSLAAICSPRQGHRAGRGRAPDLAIRALSARSAAGVSPLLGGPQYCVLC